jgi:hypothetical protein
MKKFLFLVIAVMVAWYYQDSIPDQYRFWEKHQSFIIVRNNSDRVITNVEVQVWSAAYPVGTLNPGESKTVKTFKRGESTPATVTFRYGSDNMLPQPAILNPDNGYSVIFVVNFAGVVTIKYATGVS